MKKTTFGWFFYSHDPLMANQTTFVQDPASVHTEYQQNTNGSNSYLQIRIDLDNMAPEK